MRQPDPSGASSTAGIASTITRRHGSANLRQFVQVPEAAESEMATLDVAVAASAGKPSHTKIGTSRMPPPAPVRPAKTPASRPATNG